MMAIGKSVAYLLKKKKKRGKESAVYRGDFYRCHKKNMSQSATPKQGRCHGSVNER